MFECVNRSHFHTSMSSINISTTDYAKDEPIEEQRVWTDIPFTDSNLSIIDTAFECSNDIAVKYCLVPDAMGNRSLGDFLAVVDKEAVRLGVNTKRLTVCLHPDGIPSDSKMTMDTSTIPPDKMSNISIRCGTAVEKITDALVMPSPLGRFVIEPTFEDPANPVSGTMKITFRMYALSAEWKALLAVLRQPVVV